MLLIAPYFCYTKIISFQQLKTSVLNRPSQQVRRELALGERFSGFSQLGRSTGPPQKPQESCHSEGGSGGRRERITLKLADGVDGDSKLCRPIAWRAKGRCWRKGNRKGERLWGARGGMRCARSHLNGLPEAASQRSPSVASKQPSGPAFRALAFRKENESTQNAS